jgi:hypothetical protein
VVLPDDEVLARNELVLSEEDEAVACALVDDRPAGDDSACDEPVDEPPGRDAVGAVGSTDVLVGLAVWPDDEADTSEVAVLLALVPPGADACIEHPARRAGRQAVTTQAPPFANKRTLIR